METVRSTDNLKWTIGSNMTTPDIGSMVMKSKIY